MPTVTIGNNTGDDFSGFEDTAMRSSSPTTNYDTRTTIQISENNAADHNIMLFRATGISNLPASLTVSSATISLYKILFSDTGAQIATFYKSLRAWITTQATWNIWSTGNNWTTAGAKGSGTDRSATTSETLTMDGATGSYVTSDDLAQIAADVEDFADGTLTNDGWIAERTDGTDDGTYRQFASSEGTDGQRPYLTATYTTGAPTGIVPFRRRIEARKAA